MAAALKLVYGTLLRRLLKKLSEARGDVFAIFAGNPLEKIISLACHSELSGDFSDVSIHPTYDIVHILFIDVTVFECIK